MATILLENDNVKVIYYEDKKYLFARWSGFVTSNEFRKAASEINRMIKETHAQLLLSDNSDWKAIPPNDHGWAAYNWFPEAEVNGIKKMATVPSRDYFTRDAEKSIERMAEVRCMEIQNFPTVEKALEWLTATKTIQKCT